jgi:hypothetical protein
MAIRVLHGIKFSEQFLKVTTKQGQNTFFGEGALAFYLGKISAIFAYLGKNWAVS